MTEKLVLLLTIYSFINACVVWCLCKSVMELIKEVTKLKFMEMEDAEDDR